MDLPAALDWVRRNQEAHIGSYTQVLVNGTLGGYYLNPVQDRNGRPYTAPPILFA